MSMWKKLAGGVAFTAFATAIVQPAMAQTTTSALGGSINLADGMPASGATIVLTDTRTNATRTATTSGSGSFTFQGLNVGGPYQISVTMTGQQPIKVSDITVALGSPTSVNLQFSGAAIADVVTITGTSSAVAQVTTGPEAAFTLATLEHAPAINNDVKDVLKLDPRIYLDESFGGSAGSDGIQCGGAHPRYTSLTVDGITMSDGFGLGTNNYPSERMPFPYGAINQVSVELAPFSVLYGGFTGCNVNAVTKSGTNSFHGGLSYDFTNDGLRSHRTLSPITRLTSHQATDRVPEFEEKRYSASLGGPIIPDTLFFFGAYEKAEFSNFFTRGPAGSGAPTVPTGLTQSVYDQIVDIAKTKYGYDPGGTVLSSPQEDEKYLARLDWNITDRHRAVVSYDHSKAFQLVEANSGNTSFEFSSHLYQRGGELTSYNAELLSDWTDNFSTDLRYGRNEWDGTVKCVDGAKFGEVRITLASGTNVYMGCDRSRQANDLNYTVDSIVANGTYHAGDHTILGGFEQRSYDIFNQFVQDAQGTYFFSNGGGSDGVTKFLNGTPDTVQYASAKGTNSPVDASAVFGYDINTAYLQDTIDATATLSFNVGLRYEWYTSSDAPRLNPKFVSRYGFGNNSTFDGESILQPRFSFNWEATPDIKIHGGAGLFSGGNPNVFLSNGFSTDGQTLLRLTANGTTTQGLSTTNIGTTASPFNVFNIFNETFVNDEGGHFNNANPTGQIWGIPKKLFDLVGAGAAVDTEVDAVDPNFRIPAAWKFDIGGSWNFNLANLKDFFLTADWLYSKDRDASAVVDLSLVRVGTAPDGQPVYRRIDRSIAGCDTNPGTVTTANAACRRSTQDFMLTNTPGGYQNVMSVALSKSWLDDTFDTMIGYAHMDSRDRSPMTSSVAFSNWGNIATPDINNNPLANSNYEIPNRWTMQLAYHKAFFGDYNTRVTLTGQAYQSKPYTFTMASTLVGTDGAYGEGQPQVHPFYVPSGPGATDDPKVTYLAAFTAKNPATGKSQLDLLNEVIDTYHLPRGKTLSRNEFSGQWNNKFDLKLEQELPGGFPGAKATGFVIVENIGNLINSDWGQVYEAQFPSRISLVAAGINGSNQYVYQGTQALTTTIGTPVQAETLVPAVSFWTVKFGLSYKF